MKNGVTKENLQCTSMWKEMRVGDPDAYYFEIYLQWLVKEKDFDAGAIIDVMFYSHKYKDKYYFEWLEEYVSEYYDLPKIIKA